MAKVGGTLVVRLRNRLPEPTGIHLHGLPVPPTWPAPTRAASGAAWRGVRVLLPAAGSGHVLGPPATTETVQLENGLYGALIVDGTDEPPLRSLLDVDHIDPITR